MDNIVPIYSVSYILLWFLPHNSDHSIALHFPQTPEPQPDHKQLSFVPAKLLRESFMAYWNLFPSQTPFSPTKQPLGVIFPRYREPKGWNLLCTL